MKFHRAKLDNGLEIVAETNESAYSAAIGFFVKAGARNETPEVAGVSHFLEHMLFKGTPGRTAMDVNRQLDEMGADANAFTTEEHTVYYASVLPDLVDETVELLGDLMRPALRPEDFETEKQVILEEISMYEDQPPFGADDKSRELFFAGHPLGNSVLGSVGSISLLSVESMRNYLDAYYRPENIVLAAAGRIDFDRLVRKASQLHGGWNVSDFSSNGNDAMAESCRRVRGRRGFHRIFKENATQQHTILLSDGPCGLDADRYAAGLLAGMIGDDVGSRLYWELVDDGLADEAALSSCEFLDNGFFATALSSEPEVAEDVLARTRKIYAGAMRNGLTREELDRSKNKILSRLVLANERPGGRLFSIGGDWIVRRQYRSVRDDLEEIQRLTLADVHAVLEKYPLDAPLSVTVGPLEPFDGFS